MSITKNGTTLISKIGNPEIYYNKSHNKVLKIPDSWHLCMAHMISDWI